MNDQVDRYRLVKRIGKGGMAEVFLASADGPHGFSKRVAIKKILPQHCKSNSDFERRFIREANIAVALEHANIVQVLDFGATDETLYLVMEFVDGSDLRTLLLSSREQARIKGRAIPLPCVVQIAIELCEGLSFAHKRGIVHRDISPANILLSRNGAVKIADFGIAKAMDSFKSEVGLIVGKWRYMSPEQTRGETLDHRSDIFSFGIVLFELLTGRVLFDGKNTEAIVRQICDLSIPEVPEHFGEVLSRCLSRLPEDRYQEAKDIVAALRGICLKEQWLPSSDDVARALSLQTKSKFEKTQPLFAIEEASGPSVYAPVAQGVEDEMRRLGVEDNALSRITQLDSTDTDNKTSTTVLLKAHQSDSSLPTWKTETIEVGKIEDHADSASVTLLRPPERTANVGQRKKGIALLFVVAIALIALVYLLSTSTPEIAQKSEEDAGSISQGALVIADAAAPSGPDASVGASAALDASVALDASSTFAESKHVTPNRTPKSSIAIWVDPWADIYFRGRKIGRAPKKNLRLPHGRHKLRLVNPRLGVEKTVTVRVPSAKPYRFRLAPSR